VSKCRGLRSGAEQHYDERSRNMKKKRCASAVSRSRPRCEPEQRRRACRGILHELAEMSLPVPPVYVDARSAIRSLSTSLTSRGASLLSV